MKRQLRFFILITVVLCFCYALSQQRQGETHPQLLLKYRQAQTYYDSATMISSSADYSEEKENEYNKKALLHFRALLNEIPDNVPSLDSLQFFTAFKVGELEHYLEHFREALAGYGKAIRTVQKGNLPDSLLFKPFLYAGILHYSTNHYDSATLFFRKADAIQLKYGYRLEESERLFNTFGALYYEQGDYQQARNYFLKAMELLPKHHPYYSELYSYYNINLAQIYFKLEEYDRANAIYQQLLAGSVSSRNEIYHNLGLINLNLGAPEKALHYFRNVNYAGNKTIWLYNNTGEAFLHLKQYDSAKIYFDKAIEVSKSYGNNTDPVASGQTFKNLGDLEAIMGHDIITLQFYQKALHQFYPSFTDTSIRSNPIHFTGAFSYINLFHTLIAKAETFNRLYKKMSQLPWAIEELIAYRSAFELVAYVEKTYESDEARLFLNKIKYIIHGAPIDIAFELYQKTGDKKYLEDLYVFDQQNKASVLALKRQTSDRAAGLDSSLTSKERAIRSEITRLSLRVIQTQDSVQRLSLNKTIRDQQIALGKIQDQLSDSSGYVSNSIPSVKDLQNVLLDNKTAIISYHLSEKNLTVITITKNSFNCIQRTLFDGFHGAMASFIQSVKQPDSGHLASESHRIRSFLLPDDLKNIERLIIIPDDELHYLSFESLQDAQGKFLVEKYAVQYQYATTLLKKQTLNLSGHSTVSFAPFANSSYQDSSLNLQALPNSIGEIQKLKGEKYLGVQATRQQFLSSVSRFEVVHLATHAAVNTEQDQLSFVAFNPEKQNTAHNFLLFSGEIAGLHLQGTDLVILSACKTGSGNLVKGEGIMSLSRAFSYAGCNNIITTLWKANDFSTAYLTRKVHFYLDRNYTIDKALRQAKLDYLADVSVNPRLKHPFYWSHLVYIGNYESEEKSLSLWIWLLAPIGIVVSLLLIRRKERSGKGNDE